VINKDEFQQYRDQQEIYDQLLMDGNQCVEREDWPAARQCFRQAAVLCPDRPEPFVAMGVLAMQTQRNQAAMEAYRTALAIDENCVQAYAGLAMLHHEQQRHPQAFEMYLKCLELDGDNLLALLGLFQTSCQMGTFCKIIHYLEAFLDNHPDDHSVMFCLATLNAREGRLNQARQQLLTVLAGDKTNTDAATLLSEIDERIARQQDEKEVA
jgi:tetratricopeptide (TPR) repeat protein